MTIYVISAIYSSLREFVFCYILFLAKKMSDTLSGKSRDVNIFGKVDQQGVRHLSKLYHYVVGYFGFLVHGLGLGEPTFPWHFLNFSPLPHGHGSFLPTPAVLVP